MLVLLSFTKANIFHDDFLGEFFTEDDFGDLGVADAADKRPALGHFLNYRFFAEAHFPKSLANPFFPPQAFDTDMLAGLGIREGFGLGVADAFVFFMGK